MNDQKRERIRAALESHFERTTSPRFLLSLIVFITGGVGFLVSYALLHSGETDMWVRYPASVAAAYLVFLLLLRIWAEWERHRINPETAKNMAGQPSRSPSYGGSSNSHFRWADLLDIPDIGGADEGCLLGCVFTVVIVAIGGAILVLIESAPVLIADIFLDAVLMSLLYKHLKTAARQHWLGTAIRRTWATMLITAVALSIAGAVIQWYWPEAKSIGDMHRTEHRKTR